MAVGRWLAAAVLATALAACSAGGSDGGEAGASTRVSGGPTTAAGPTSAAPTATADTGTGAPVATSVVSGATTSTTVPTSTTVSPTTTVASFGPGAQPTTAAEARLVLAAAGPDDATPDYDPLLAVHLEAELDLRVRGEQPDETVFATRLRAARPDGTLLGIYYVCAASSDEPVDPCRSAPADYARWAGECRAGGGTVLGRVAEAGDRWLGIGTCSVATTPEDPAEAVAFVRAVVTGFGVPLVGDERLDRLTQRWAQQRAARPEPMFRPASLEGQALLTVWEQLRGDRAGDCGALVLGRPTEGIDVASYRFLDVVRAGVAGRPEAAFAVDAAAGRAVIDVVWCWTAP